MNDKHPILWQIKLGALKIINRGYGLDYYWRDKWLFVSAPAYVGWRLKGYETIKRAAWFDFRFGLYWYGKPVIAFTNWRRWIRSRL